ncbi:hypothetical protein LSTR_LSTR014260 [Laodelphax striatellus]|uniref:EF-hand domain-containing protein n=1 Tax=Laodelphax striatellus TaxID=195883 RepID=A0A482WQ09_LAOST|nr:hypothetical protein LSTR_LSTR014260 [Laodelphax striatellus]
MLRPHYYASLHDSYTNHVGNTRVFKDDELSQVVDIALGKADTDYDGFITWEEYVMDLRRNLMSQTMYSNNYS